MTFSFGVLIAAGVVMEQLIPQALWQPTEKSFAAALRNFWFGHDVLILLLFASVFFASVFGRANIIVALARHQLKPSFHGREMASRFGRLLIVDITAGLLLTILVIVFAFPPFVAFSSNRGAFEGAIMISAFSFLPVLFTVACIRQYGIFYFLLSPLQFRSAIDRSVALFSRFMARSLAFWIFSFAVVVVFTFFLNAAMLGTSSLFRLLGFSLFSEHASSLIGFIGLVWFSVFNQALSLRFFEDLATEKTEGQAVSGEQVLDPGMPIV
jgi:hypothetical protein